MTKVNKDYYLVRKQKAIDYLGGQCVDCGISDSRVLQFDHVAERRDGKKTIGSYLWSWWSWSKVTLELDKCQLRCANCHMIKTSKEPMQIRGARNQYSVRSSNGRTQVSET